MRRILAGFFVLFIFALARCACADSVSPLLEGYFHPGRAIPLRWIMDHPGSIDVTCESSMETKIDLTDHPEGVLPFLTLDDTSPRVAWSAGGDAGEIQLHSLGEMRPLVVSFTGGRLESFRGLQPVMIELDPSQLIGPASAWESADAMIFSGPQWKSLPNDFRNQLLCEGISVVVISPAPPDGSDAWAGAMGEWTACNNLRASLPISSDAYAPAFSWPGGRSVEFRRAMFLVAAIFSCLVFGISLWRSPRAGFAIVLVSAIALPGIAMYAGRQSPIAILRGSVAIIPETTIPTGDSWVYQASHRDTDFKIAVNGLVHPICTDLAQWKSARLVLECDPAGNPIQLSGRLQADLPLAIVQRTAMKIGKHERGLVTSPLRQLARPSIYPGYFPVDQYGSPDDPSGQTLIISAN